jgi:hypothetical protein
VRARTHLRSGLLAHLSSDSVKLHTHLTSVLPSDCSTVFAHSIISLCWLVERTQELALDGERTARFVVPTTVAPRYTGRDTLSSKVSATRVTAATAFGASAAWCTPWVLHLVVFRATAGCIVLGPAQLCLVCVVRSPSLPLAQCLLTSRLGLQRCESRWRRGEEGGKEDARSPRHPLLRLGMQCLFLV